MDAIILAAGLGRLNFREAMIQRYLAPGCYNDRQRRSLVSLVLDLPPELETELAAKAARAGLPLPEYAVRLLASGVGPSPAPHTTAEVLAYWQAEGLIGMRADITDGPAHARDLRERAQRRDRA